MALIVETGAGLSNAESYVSAAEADAYFEKRGVSAWAAITDDDLKDALLRRATDYMGQIYRLGWKGDRTTLTQALDWPRTDVERVDRPDTGSGYADYYASDSVPDEVKRACMELALRANDADLLADVGRETSAEQVGDISVTYVVGSIRQKDFAAVNSLLAPLLRYRKGSMSVVRS